MNEEILNQDIVNEIAALKQEKDAVILAHYYVRPEVQAIADYIGDSFYLSKVAANLDAKTIVFAGVFFMGESAKVLNPGKTVLLPDMKADCAMAHMADVATIQKMRETYDDLAVVCYINSTAELKQHSDVCVTSSNAVKIVKALPNKNIFFIPDRNLARYVAAQVPEKNFVFNEGYCPIHEQILMNELHEVKAAHPQALVLAHPECKKELLDEADYIGSTSGIIDYAANSDAKEFIICTENGIRYELEQKNPDKQFYFTKTEPVCPDMKTVTLEKVRDVLKYGTNDVQVTDKLREESQKPLTRMLELGK
ncbi:MAG: quinolinate synthase NadA [Peptococcaceae bacterium]|nr:quinolinate synthase NadA [Peptococcaceae bacterium]MBP3585857.1 quinolinate synthase NadA [Peptococcaceae bacterium]